jgi:acyl-coenzyme A synthetase/AMP-(fatty) acid ligase
MLNAPKVPLVAICCRHQAGFMQAHSRAISERRTSLLVPASEWRQLPALSARFNISHFWSDEPDNVALRTFNPDNVTLFAQPCLSPLSEWPDPLAILLTSGSTGEPQAICKSRKAIAGELHALQDIVKANANDCIVATVSLEHMFGYTFAFLLAQFSHSELYPQRVFMPAELMLLCQKSAKKIWLITTPVHLRAYVSLKLHFKNIAGVICATSPLSTELARQAALCFGVAITEIYGSTETGALAYRLRHDYESQAPDWHALPGIDIQIDAEGRAHGEASHLDGRIALGDRLAASGSGFQLLEREGDLIKICGKRHSRQALNNLLCEAPGVRDASYFFPQDGNNNHETARPLAFAVLEPGVTSQMVLTHLRGLVDDVFLPRPLYQLEALPRSATGKLTDTDLRNLYQISQENAL